MRYRIYHSLDRPSSIFGMKGRFLVVMIVGAWMSAVLGILAGQVTQLLVGVAVTTAGCVASYLAVIGAQARIDERDLPKIMAHSRLPMCWSASASALRNIWKGIN